MFLLLFCFIAVQVQMLHLHNQKLNSTVKDVLNAGCPSMPIVYITNTSSKCIYGNINPTQYQNSLETLRENNKVVVCPQEKPFSNGIQCIACSKNQLFNLQTKRCQQCSNGAIYSQLQKKCIVTNQSTSAPDSIGDQYYTDFNNLNLVTNGKPFDQIKKQTMANISATPIEHRKVCPTVTPFFNGSTCIQCNSQNPYFDLQRKSCIACQKGTVFSPQKHRCIISQIRYLTSPDAPNLLLSSDSIEGYRNKFQEEKKNFPVCPEVTPYFNGKNCISCNKQNPIFDIQRKECVSCPLNKTFDPKKKSCVSRIYVHPTLQRYLMNIK